MRKKSKFTIIIMIVAFCLAFTGIPALEGASDAHAAAPGSIKVTATCKGWTNTVALRWNKISNPQQGYAVVADGKVVAHLGKTATTYTVKNLKSGTRHEFRIRTWKKVRTKMYYNTKTKKWQWSQPAPGHRGKTSYGMKYVYYACSPVAYATTAKAKYTIKYDVNGGTGAPANGTKLQDTVYRIPNTVPKRSGHVFWGWEIVGKGFSVHQPGDTLPADMNGNYTLRAQWRMIFN